MAAANSIVAVECGAVHVQGVVNGFGERCGNANLCTIIPALELKLGRECVGREKLETLTEVSRYVAEIANIMHDSRQPYVGEAAFAHKGGAHIDAMMKNPGCYEHVDPASVGNERQFLLSQQAGTSTVVHKLERILPGVDKRDPRVIALLERLKQLEFEGFSFEAADASFELLALRELGLYKEPFEVLSWRVINRHGNGGGLGSSENEAIVKVRVGDEVRHTVANGHGPVDALSSALRKALEGAFPTLEEVRLNDYKVRDLSSKAGTAARVRVLIESSDKKTGVLWGTVGVSEDILEASWQALLDSLSYKLMRDTAEKR
jgi:2-isopropylmalate synthase